MLSPDIRRREPQPVRHWSDVCAVCGRSWTVSVHDGGTVTQYCDRCAPREAVAPESETRASDA